MGIRKVSWQCWPCRRGTSSERSSGIEFRADLCIASQRMVFMSRFLIRAPFLRAVVLFTEWNVQTSVVDVDSTISGSNVYQRVQEEPSHQGYHSPTDAQLSEIHVEATRAAIKKL